MLIFKGGGRTLVGNGMVLRCVGVGWGIKKVFLHTRLEPYTTAQENTLLSCQVREILSLYRPTVSFHENHQAFGASLRAVLGSLKREFIMLILG